MIKLLFQTGPLAGKRFSVDVAITLGRDAASAIVIPDPLLSRVHCRIHFDEGRPFLTDLGSTNGTFLNDSRIVGAELSDGAIIRIGDSCIEVQFVGGEPHEAHPVAAMKTVRRQMDAAAEPSGSIFGAVAYFLRRRIADGGMGAIYEADQIGAEGFIKRVAIKTILPTFAERDSFVESFIGEARLVANLVHQSIVQIHHLGRHEGGYYIAMEYIDGINLSDFIRHHRHLGRQVPIELATFIVNRIARGLAYAHAKRDDDGHALGLVHRDVSPHNIMISYEGEVKLTDFGVARAARFMEEDNTYLVGSVEYMSPEQAQCASVDGRSDIFSLGLVYYELITGHRVFRCEDDDLDEAVRRIVTGKIPDPHQYREDLPEPVNRILKGCLQRHPENRYESADDLCAALDEILHAFERPPTGSSMTRYMAELCDDD